MNRLNRKVNIWKLTMILASVMVAVSFMTYSLGGSKAHAATSELGDILLEDFSTMPVGKQVVEWSLGAEYTKVIEDPPGNNVLQIFNVEKSTVRKAFEFAEGNVTVQFKLKFPELGDVSIYMNGRGIEGDKSVFANFIHLVFGRNGVVNANSGQTMTRLSTQLEANEWYEIALEISFEDQWYNLYIDGTLEARSQSFLGDKGVKPKHVSYVGFQAPTSVILVDDIMATTGLVGSQGGSADSGKAGSGAIDIAGHWAESNIKKAIQLGFVQGYEDQTFRPNNQVTRAEFAAFATRALSLPPGDMDQLDFTDEVPSWATEVVASAVGVKLFSGYEDGTFRANRGISRAEMAVALVRMLGVELMDDASLNYSDAAEIPAWAMSYIAKGKEMGLFEGWIDGRFAADELVTRAEVVSTLLAVLDYS